MLEELLPALIREVMVVDLRLHGALQRVAAIEGPEIVGGEPAARL